MRPFLRLVPSIFLLLSFALSPLRAEEAAAPAPAKPAEAPMPSNRKDATSDASGIVGVDRGPVHEEEVAEGPPSALDTVYHQRKTLREKLKQRTTRLREALARMRSHSQQRKEIQSALKEFEAELKTPSSFKKDVKRDVASAKSSMARLKERMKKLKEAVIAFEKSAVEKVGGTLKHANVMREVREQADEIQRTLNERQAELDSIVEEGEGG